MPPSRRGLLRGLSHGVALSALVAPFRTARAATPSTERQRQALRPRVVAFDVVETLVSLEPLRGRLAAAGLPNDQLEVWFARLLRDAFALDATGVYQPFKEVAASTLAGLFAEHGLQPDPATIEGVVASFAELPAHPDVEPAMRALRDANIRIITLTNGGAETTHRLLERAGVRDLVERVISIEEVRRWKPHREVYLHAADSTGVEPRRLTLVAAHAWDVHGASRAGLGTGFVARQGKPFFPSLMDAPDVTGATLVEVARRLAALPSG